MVLMIAIGTGVFLGFHIEWKSLEQNADAFLRETKYADYRLYSESGFTEDDLRSVRGIAGVDAASRFLSIPAAVKGTSSSVALQVTEDAAVSSPLVMSGAAYDESGDGIWLSDRFADENGIQTIRTHCGQKNSMCVFEFIYFARPDSVIEGASVHRARLRAGHYLALEHPVQADVVIGCPDSGLDAALGFAQQSGIPYGVGFVKNRYIGRTFIQPTQGMRENSVKIKLNAISETVKGKRVVLIDDSIVRGTTSAKVVKLLRHAGATEIHMRISSPPFISECFFGTDIDSKENLIANKHSVEEIAKIIGVDSLGFLSTDSVVKIAENAGCGFCSGCFTGKYPIDVPKDIPKDKFEMKFEE